jgi:hypothetical protein
MSDRGSNGTWRRAAKKIALDPNNEDVAYVGIQNNSLSGLPLESRSHSMEG